jgi:hypothetical protein
MPAFENLPVSHSYDAANIEYFLLAAKEDY